MDIAQIRNKINVPPELKKEFARLVAAGMHVMFDPKSRTVMIQQLKSSPDIVKNISEGVAGLMAILFKQNSKMDQRLIIPAALTLLTHVLDYIEKTKMAQLSPQQMGQVIHATVYAVMHKFNVPDNAITQAINPKQGPTQTTAPTVAAPPAAPQRQGLLTQATAAPTQGGM